MISKIHMAGDNHRVVTLEGVMRGKQHNTPCAECPWRRDAPVGAFPAEAFRISAETAYDGSMHQFSCHMAGAERPSPCVGFLLRNANNNIGVRLRTMRGELDYQKLSDGGFPLYDNYREMAIANGVSPDDPVLKPCRANDE